jgi:hypothetical protein
MNRLRVGILLLLTCAEVSAQTTLQGVNVIGQDSTNHVITTAVPFLSITPDARAAGMGDVGAAVSADANSAFWNAGKLAFVDKSYGASGSYTPWLGKIINDMNIFYLSGFYKITRQQTIAASMKYFDLGEIQFNNGPDPIANNLGRFNPREYAFDVTYSQLLTENLGIGGSLRYINSNLTGALSTGANDARPGNSVAVDIGLFYTKPLVSKNSNLSLAGSITNIGSKITYSDANNKDFIPTNLRLGGAFKTAINAYNSLTFGLDFNKLLVPSPGPGNKGKPLLSGMFGSFTDAEGGFSEEIREITTALGMEYWYDNGTGGALAGRIGYFFEAWDKGNRKYLTAGVGGRLNNFGVDLAYMVPTNKRENALAETLRFTISMMMEKKVIQEDAPVD